MGPFYSITAKCPSSLKDSDRMLFGGRRLIEVEERYRIPIVHGNHQAIPLGIIGHRGGTEYSRRNQFRLLTWPDPGHRADPYATDVLRAVRQNRQSVVSRVDRLLRLKKLAGRRE